MTFKTVLASSALWDGEMRQVIVDGRRVLLVKIDDHVYAYEDRCAHQGVELSRGTLSGDVITCCAHHWQFNVRSGHGLNPKAARLKPIDVRVVDDDIQLDVSGAAAGGGPWRGTDALARKGHVGEAVGHDI